MAFRSYTCTAFSIYNYGYFGKCRFYYHRIRDNTDIGAYPDEFNFIDIFSVSHFFQDFGKFSRTKCRLFYKDIIFLSYGFYTRIKLPALSTAYTVYDR